MIAYLDTVSSAAPPHGGAYNTSPVRIGVAAEDRARRIVAWRVFLIDPPSGTFGFPERHADRLLGIAAPGHPA